MARTRRFDDLRADVRRLADIKGATARHPEADLKRMVNESCQRFRELVSDNGHEYYLTDSGSNPLTPGTATVNVPVDMIRIYGIEITVDGSVRTLHPFSMAERNDYGGLLGGGADAQGVPAYYRVLGSLVYFMPTPDAAYLGRIWYLKTHTDLVNDADLFDGIAGWEEWIVWDCVCKVAVRDQDDTLYTMASTERAKYEAEIKTNAPKRVRAPLYRLDTKGRREGDVNRARRGWW